MDSHWLDDLAALAEARTLTEAAEMRAVTQPAFSRRIQKIERWLGVPVLDRTRKPAQVSAAVLGKIAEMRTLSNDLRRLRMDLRDAEAVERRVSIVAQHSISTGILSRFMASVQANDPTVSVRLRAANRDECYVDMMTRNADIMVAYEIGGLPIAPDEAMVERAEVGRDLLCPMATAKIAAKLGKAGKKPASLRIIAYPAGTFLGEVLAREILPKNLSDTHVQIACETALTPAALAMAVEGVGVAWLPRSLCEAHLASGSLVALSEDFGLAPMKIICARTTRTRTGNAEIIWKRLSGFLAGSSTLSGRPA